VVIDEPLDVALDCHVLRRQAEETAMAPGFEDVQLRRDVRRP
jgi:hypothetical protein